MKFDFERWSQWLKSEAEKLCMEGFHATWKPTNGELRGTVVEVKGKRLIASFRQFENGWVDYDVARQTGGFIASEAMIPVRDKNFAAAFDNFRKALGLP